ncbi:uncharacterized protein LOC110907742 [Helianthus annuus]|uniref:uncharacterized protein LOC110907742 n=1 Tax=Helianthus annuus TaxID=4232 RepID=UPI000B8FE3C1|nr:uncharacterized protein LOC110907742 [Helianthus annuus]
MEIVNIFMQRASESGIFQGCNLPNNGPRISHLCYADDVIFIGAWSSNNILALNRILRWLCLVSGLKVNRNKCHLYGVGVPQAEVARLAALANCSAGSLPFLHLGVPIGVNMKRARYWKPVLDKFSSKLYKWKARHLSFAGRMTLAKSVLGSLPSYYLSLFAAPKCVLKSMKKIRRDFIWGKSSTGHKMRWIRWESLVKAKKFGGMGLGAVQGFNLAMLSKWWWRFKASPNELWAKVVTAIHHSNSSNSPPNFVPLKKSITGVWKDVVSVEAAFASRGVSLSANIVPAGDSWKWSSDPNGSFSVKQVRLDLDSADATSGSESFVYDWNPWATPKANYLLWRAMTGKIASKVGLHIRGIPLGDTCCSRCGCEEEDPDHIFVRCLWARCIWWNVLVWMRVPYPANISNLKELIDFIKNQPGGKVWKRIVYLVALATVWSIWRARNEKVFEDRFIPILLSVEQAKEDAFLWVCNRTNLKKICWEKWKDFDLLDLL